MFKTLLIVEFLSENCLIKAYQQVEYSVFWQQEPHNKVFSSKCCNSGLCMYYVFCTIALFICSRFQLVKVFVGIFPPMYSYAWVDVLLGERLSPC